MLDEVLEHLTSCWVTQVIVGTVVAGISIAFFVRQGAASKLARLRAEWDGREKDVVTLHMFDRALTSPNPSPFPIKLETYLRAAGIK